MKHMELAIATVAPAMWSRAVEVFGSEEKAAGWMWTRLHQLGGRTPCEVLAENANSVEVATLLDRIDYVIYN